MNYFVKIIPPSKRARIHDGDCPHCRNGQGQENQDRGVGPTIWVPAHPKGGLTLSEVEAIMGNLNYEDVGRCYYCEQRGAFNGEILT